MKKLALLKSLAVILAASSAMTVAQAHLPFVAPQTYFVNGENTSALSGFAESPFQSEGAIRGFEFTITTPDGKSEATSVVAGPKIIGVIDIETKNDGTYKIEGKRENKLHFAKVNGKWKRIFDSHRTDLPPLSERDIILPKEVTDKMAKIETIRHESIISYFTKYEPSQQVLQTSNKGLQVGFSQHPNQLNSQKALTLSVTIDGKAQKGLTVVASKQLTAAKEQLITIKTTTDQKGQAEIIFPTAGQYFIEINSPEAATGEQPKKETYRQHIAVFVN